MVVFSGRKPSLYDAQERVARAREHIKSLDGIISDHSSRFGWSGPMSPGIKTAAIGFDLPPICSILIGEIAYNLKAALDYLIFELFYLATGEFNNSTKFLIVGGPKEWERNFPQEDVPRKVLKKLWLHRLKTEHQVILKELQPFSGTDWTKTLQKITNPDRHRQLIELVGELGYAQIEKLSPERAETVNKAGFPADMFIHFQTSHKVTLDGIGAHAVETMQHLAGEVAKVLVRFEPDFR